MLSQRDNFIRAARRQNPEWIPLDFGVSAEARQMFAAHLGEGVDIGEHFKFDTKWIGPAHGTRRPTPDWRLLYYANTPLPSNTTIEPEWGVARTHFADSDDDQTFHPLHAIETEAEFDAYPWPDDVGAAFRYEGMKERVAEAHAKGFAVVGGGLNFFEHPWGLAGFEKTLLGMGADESWARKLFQRHAADLVRQAAQIALTGADVLQTGSDVATQLAPLMSPSMWREWIFPLMRDAIAAARRVKPDLLVFYHSDGNVEPLIEGFIEAGVDILNPIQPECMDIFALKRNYGGRLAFHGGIGVQTVMPFGTPQEVRDTVRRTIEGMSANGGGYLCSTAHMIRPEVPWENVMAFVETVKEFGHP